MKTDYMHLRIDPVVKEQAKEQAKKQKRSLSNYMIYLIEKDTNNRAKLMNKKEMAYLMLKSDIETELNKSFIPEITYGRICGIAWTLFSLDILSEEEYKNYKNQAYDKWNGK